VSLKASRIESVKRLHTKAPQITRVVVVVFSYSGDLTERLLHYIVDIKSLHRLMLAVATAAASSLDGFSELVDLKYLLSSQKKK